MKSSGSEDTAISEMNVIPFIDICLVLLIIVLMTSATQSNFKKVFLPKADSTEYRDMNLAITLTVAAAVDADGEPVLDSHGQKKYQYYLEDDDKPIDPKNLWMAMSAVQGGTPWSMLVIRTEKDAPYDVLAMAILCGQALGVADINLAVKGEDEADET